MERMQLDELHGASLRVLQAGHPLLSRYKTSLGVHQERICVTLRVIVHIQTIGLGERSEGFWCSKLNQQSPDMVLEKNVQALPEPVRKPWKCSILGYHEASWRDKLS